MDSRKAAFSIWIDADSCPKKAREIALRCAARLHVPAYLVANRQIPYDKQNAMARMVLAPKEQDGADTYIAEHAEKEDIVITKDIPFAARLVEKGICAMNDRGVVFRKDNIDALLAERNYSVFIAQLGLAAGGGTSYSKDDVHKFANCLDNIVAKKIRRPR